MAKRTREKISFIEKVQFQDVERAKRAVALAKINQIRILIGLVFAVISTGFTAFGLFGDGDKVLCFATAFLLAFPAYLIGGGIFKALKAAWKVAKIGWFIIPVFPADLLCGIGTLIIGMFCFFCIPVFFVGANYLQHKRTLDAANSYLAQCGYAMAVVEAVSATGA